VLVIANIEDRKIFSPLLNPRRLNAEYIKTKRKINSKRKIVVALANPASFNFLKLNSIPIRNSNKMLPISENKSIVSLSFIIPRQCGPKSIPKIIKKITAGALRRKEIRVEIIEASAMKPKIEKSNILKAYTFRVDKF
jgi:hypothetical protein